MDELNPAEQASAPAPAPAADAAPAPAPAPAADAAPAPAPELQTAEGVATVDTAATLVQVPNPEPQDLHPVFGVLGQLEADIVARTADEMHKLQTYVATIRAHIAALF